MQKTEYEKMIAGELYNAGDEQLMQMRCKAREIMHEYNQSLYDKQKRETILKRLLGRIGKNVDIQTPFFVIMVHT